MEYIGEMNFDDEEEDHIEEKQGLLGRMKDSASNTMSKLTSKVTNAKETVKNSY